MDELYYNIGFEEEIYAAFEQRGYSREWLNDISNASRIDIYMVTGMSGVGKAYWIDDKPLFLAFVQPCGFDEDGRPLTTIIIKDASQEERYIGVKVDKPMDMKIDIDKTDISREMNMLGMGGNLFR